MVGYNCSLTSLIAALAVKLPLRCLPNALTIVGPIAGFSGTIGVDVIALWSLMAQSGHRHRAERCLLSGGKADIAESASLE